MPARWGKWRRGEGGRSQRLCIGDDRSTYIQFDNERAPVFDEDRNQLSRGATQVLLIDIESSLNLTPRSAFVSPPSPPSGTDQAVTGTLAAESERSYQAVHNEGQSSTGVNVQSANNDDDGYEENDVVPKLPTDQLILYNSAMARQPLAGKLKTDLTSAKTSRKLPDGFVQRHSSFFVLGTVFRVLWVEARGTTSQDSYEDDEQVYKTLRPMVVVSKRKSFCICAPIFSYGDQGIGKSGLIESEVQHHAIVHIEGRHPRLMSGELKWKNKMKVDDAFTVKPTAAGATLSAASRVRFDTTYPVRYNLEVLEIGRVIKEHRPRLQERWRAANSS